MSTAPATPSTRGPLAWYRRFPRDLIAEVVGLPFEERLVYAYLVDMAHMFGGRLPDDARYIAGVLGCSVRRWKTIRDALISHGKIASNGEIISISRVDLELENSRKFRDKQAENRRGGRNINGLEKPNGDPSQSSSSSDLPSDEVRSESASPSQSPSQVDADADATFLAKALKAVGPHTASGHHRLNDPEELALLHAWRAALPDAVILAKIRAVVARATKPVQRWAYFDREMARAAAAAAAAERSATILTARTG